MRSNKLSVNANKSEFLIVGNKRQLNGIQQPVQLRINDESIKKVQKVKYLGLEVDKNLTQTQTNLRHSSKVHSIVHIFYRDLSSISFYFIIHHNIRLGN